MRISKRKTAPWAVILGVGLLCGAAPPDIIVEGYKPVLHRLKFEAGPAAQTPCRVHEVQAGDTLASIAGKLLGDPGRAAEIRNLNPGLGKAEPMAGMKLDVPDEPRDTDGKKKFTFYVADMHKHVAAVEDGGVFERPYMGLRFYAVPLASEGAWKAIVGSRIRDEGSLEKLGIRSVELAGHRTIPDADPTATIETRYRIEAVGSKTVLLTLVVEKRLDAGGRPVSAEKAEAARKSSVFVLFALAGLGLAGLLALKVRARRPAAVRVPA